MKRILTLGIVLLTANSLLPAQEITFSETKFNWGTVQEKDGNVSHDFRFVNTGDKPLTIKNIITGCGCTSSEWADKVYRPGEEGTIRLVYHPEGRTENSINLVAEIYTNRAAKEVVTLEMSGEIKRQAPPIPPTTILPMENAAKTKPAFRKMNMNKYLNGCVRNYMPKLLHSKQTKSQKDYYVPCFRKANGAIWIMLASSVPIGNRWNT